MENIQEITDKIKLARKWAKKYFHADQANDPRLVDENLNLIVAFHVEFPDVDRMRVSPSCMGKPLGLWFEYRLSFNPLQWEANHPIWGYPLPPLKIND